ncbi:MAG TPA: hypothetical protein VJP02_15430 [Candidatus Sulfotelmatobacter sp.]|nr:hypothetical protein [Candidatus Sulfotelmatobacter sp.]
MFRCETAAEYNRDEWANLMSKRLLLWLTGNKLDKVRDFLQLRRVEMDFLDGEIAKYLGFRLPAPRKDAEWVQMLFPLYRERKAKAGWAADVLRRFQKGYKQGQVLPYQQDDPLSSKTPSIYEGEKHVRSNGHNDPTDQEPSDDPNLETHPDEEDGSNAI